MEMDDIPVWLIIVLIGLVIIGAIYGGVYAISWGAAQSYAGQKYDVTVTVQAVERSSRFGDHTNLWVRTYGGGDEGTGIVYKFIGFYNFTVGKDYRIVFVDEPYMIFYFLVVWEPRGRVELIEPIQ